MCVLPVYFLFVNNRLYVKSHLGLPTRSHAINKYVMLIVYR